MPFPSQQKNLNIVGRGAKAYCTADGGEVHDEDEDNDGDGDGDDDDDDDDDDKGDDGDDSDDGADMC